MAQRAAQLRLESVNSLLARVEQLELRVAELESLQEFEVIREEPARPSASGYRSNSSPPVISEERRVILERIGHWLRSCLNDVVVCLVVNCCLRETGTTWSCVPSVVRFLIPSWFLIP